MAKGTRRRGGDVRIGILATDGTVDPGRGPATWGVGRARAAFRDVGYRLRGERCHVAAGDLLAACEAFLDHATSDDVVALHEVADRAVAAGGGGAMVGVEPDVGASVPLAA